MGYAKSLITHFLKKAGGLKRETIGLGSNTTLLSGNSFHQHLAESKFMRTEQGFVTCARVNSDPCLD